MSLRVLLIDDHTLFRVGLEGLLLHRGIEIVASVSDGGTLILDDGQTVRPSGIAVPAGEGAAHPDPDGRAFGFAAGAQTPYRNVGR